MKNRYIVEEIDYKKKRILILTRVFRINGRKTIILFSPQDSANCQLVIIYNFENIVIMIYYYNIFSFLF